jgi:hypothetical protein
VMTLLHREWVLARWVGVVWVCGPWQDATLWRDGLLRTGKVLPLRTKYSAEWAFQEG